MILKNSLIIFFLLFSIFYDHIANLHSHSAFFVDKNKCVCVCAKRVRERSHIQEIL